MDTAMCGELKVALWSARLDVETEGARGMLDAREIARAERFRFERDRRRFVESRCFVRRVLGWHLGIAAEDVEFDRSEQKPRVDGELEFSFSKSGDVGVCAVTNGVRVGVDVEWVRALPDLESLVETVLSEGERREWDALPESERAERFCVVWTRKEGLGKAEGHGITPGPATIGVPMGVVDAGRWVRVEGTSGTASWMMSEFRPGEGSVATVFVEGAEVGGGVVVDEEVEVTSERGDRCVYRRLVV